MPTRTSSLDHCIIDGHSSTLGVLNHYRRQSVEVGKYITGLPFDLKAELKENT